MVYRPPRTRGSLHLLKSEALSFRNRAESKILGRGRLAESRGDLGLFSITGKRLDPFLNFTVDFLVAIIG